MKKNNRLFLMTLILIFFFSFGHDLYASSFVMPEYSNNYKKVLQEEHPSLVLDECKYESSLAAFKGNTSGALYGSQAHFLLQNNENYVFHPHYLDTVVIAIDREMTDVSVLSFRDLLITDLPISFDLGHRVDKNMWEYPRTHQIFLAMSYGLYGDYQLEALSEEIKKIDQECRFYVDDPTLPIMVTLDSIAVEMMKEGRDLEIIVPEDGTLSLAFGAFVYGDVLPFSEAFHLDLLQMGYRLMDGRSDGAYYPDEEAYEGATIVSQYDAYNGAASQVSATLMRKAFDTERYSFAKPTEITTFYLILLFFLIAYYFTLKRRVTDGKILRVLTIASGLQILFITLGVFKSISNQNAAIEIIIWYSYYIPMLMLPASLVYITLLCSQSKRRQLYQKMYRIYFVITSLLLLFVMTNYLHGKVFHVYIHGMDSYTYDYNLGYYFVIVWVLLSTAFALTILIYRGFSSPKKSAFLYPVIMNFILIIYIAAYVSGIQLIREFDISFANTMIITLYTEACMSSRLFPSNMGYKRLFLHSSLAMSITNKDHHIIEKSHVTQNVDQNFSLQKSPIIGGNFNYFEDYTSLHTAEQKLSKVNEELRLNNEFLLQKVEVNGDLAAIQAEQIVYENIDQTLISGTEKSRMLIESYKNNPADRTPLNKINALICMMKRECMFRINVLYQQEQQPGIFMNALHEIIDYTLPLNLHISLRSTYSQLLKTQDVLSMYHFFTLVIESALSEEATNLIVQLYDTADDIVFSVISDRTLFEPSSLEDGAHDKAYRFVQKPWEDGEAYLLYFRKEDRS